MGTEVLRPQDCLVERLRVSSPATFHGRKNYFPNGYTKTNRKPAAVRTDTKKKFNNQHQQQEITNSKRWSSADDVKATKFNKNECHNRNSNTNGPNGPVMGQVTILRRGVSLDSLNSKIKRDNNATTPSLNKGGGDLVAFGTERLGPEQPEMLPKQIMLSRPADVYATGAAFSVSPWPADVYAGSAFSVSPSPSSLPLPSFFKKQEFKSFDDSATRDLRRLLRLE